MKTGQRLFGFILVIDVLAFAALFALAAFQRNANVVLPSFAARWESAEAILGFIHWLPALQFLATALAIGSLAGKPEDLLRVSVVPAIILSALLASTALLVAPGYETGRAHWLDLSRRFNAALSDTKTALNEGRLREARQAYGVLKAIDRLDPRAGELELRLEAAELKAAKKADEGQVAVPVERDPAAAKAHLVQAREYYRQTDFYSANWHARKALELDPKLGEAKVLADRAWGEILAAGGTEADATKAAFFARKLEAFGRLRSGDVIAAYRLFSAMSKEDPKDADVRRYLAESLSSIQKEAFFKDEADEAAAARIFPRFLVAMPGKGGQLLAISAREAAFTPAAAFFFDLEYVSVEGGRVTSHLTTPYAKLVAKSLHLESVERENPGIVYEPQDLGGGRSPRALDVTLDVQTAYRLAAGLRLPTSASVLDLLGGVAAAPGFGLPTRPFMAELLRRMGLPFAVFGASILGILVGIRFRPRKKKPSRLAWLALPVMVATAAVAWLTVEAADAVISDWVLRVAEGPLALAVSAAVRTAILAILVILAANLRQHVPTKTED
jgi:hypothetical protein